MKSVSEVALALWERRRKRQAVHSAVHFKQENMKCYARHKIRHALRVLFAPEFTVSILSSHCECVPI